MLRAFVAFVVFVAAATAAPSPRHEPKTKTHRIQDEIQAWKEGGYPDFLQFADDSGKPVWGVVVGEQPSVRGMFKDGNPFNGDDADYSDEQLGASEDDVKFHVFTKGNNYSSVEGTQVTLDHEDFLAAGWEPALPTKIVIHGFTNSISSPIIQLIKDAYMTHGDYNVVGVDWGVLCPNPLYVTARLNVPFVGKLVGKLMSFLIEQELATADKLHVIGHSLGAHVAGISAKSLNETEGQRPARVTGLDPAWPLFIITPDTDRLSKDDGVLVDVIHSCAGLLGFPTDLGTSDFYPNGGREQPGCGLDLTGVCAHGRSYEYFAESITKGKGYQADFCDSNSDARDGTCKGPSEGCMGDEVQFKEQGSYYLKTDDVAPTKVC
ncbi:phospholipase A1 isoform X2 [Frankliniella occidentalis]|nr:phospholipase A1 isoform X2 [Frankliniella occidentalis]